MTEFEILFRDKVVKYLNLQDVDPGSITRETVFFGGGLGLDSIDAIELVIMVEKEYGIVLTVPERNQTVFGSFGALCDFVAANRGRDIKA